MSAHVAAAPHGSKRKVKGALNIQFSKSNGGQKKALSFSIPKNERADNPIISNFWLSVALPESEPCACGWHSETHESAPRQPVH